MVEFCKFHGLGNDFIVVDDTEELSRRRIESMCRRRRGIGADGVLVVESLEETADGDVRMAVYNPDGSRPEMCGNGLRCVAAYVHRRRGIEEPVVITDSGRHRCRIEEAGTRTWRVDAEIGEVVAQPGDGALEVGEEAYDYFAVDVGNPHAVIFERGSEFEVRRAGKCANDGHPDFLEGVNVEFAAEDPESGAFETIVYERGVGLTRACGTGACAVAEAVWETGRRPRSEPVRVVLPGGTLSIRSRDTGVWMCGEAVCVFCGIWYEQIDV